MLRLFLLAAVTGLAWLSLAAVATAQAVAVEDDGQSQLIPLPAVDLLRDPTGQLTVDDVESEAYSGAFTAAGDRQLSLGYAKATYWLRFELGNPSADERHWFLLLADPVLDLVEVYAPRQIGQPHQVQRAGRAVEFDAKSMTTNDFTFTIDLPAHSSRRVLIKVRSDTSLLLPLKLLSRASLVAHVQRTSSLFGLYAGVVLVTFCSFLSLFLFTRERRHLLFALVLLVLHFGLVVVLLGFDRMGFGAADPFLSRNAVPWSILLAGHVVLLFAYEFLRVGATRAWPRWVLQASWCVTILQLVLGGISTSKTWVIPSATVTALFIVVLIIAAAVVAMRAKVPDSRMFSWSWICQVVAVLVGAGHSVGLVALRVTVAESIMVGAVLQFAILTVGMAWGFFRSEQQRRLAYGELSRTYTQLEKMIGPHTHVVSRIKLGVDLEHTMPTRSSVAAVLCWDVIDSSRVPSTVFLPLMAVVFRRVHELLMIGYDGDGLVATGYRVSEAGDGGLITVGFPYVPPAGAEAVSSVAHDLAERIIAVAREVFSTNPATAGLAIGVGIVQGVVEGSYHESGAILYRIEGRPLTLATRYESHRKCILPRLPQARGCPVIIHDEVFRRLRPQEQQCYQLWDASHPDGKIRDDPATTRAYFRLLELDVGAQNAQGMGRSEAA